MTTRRKETTRIESARRLNANLITASRYLDVSSRREKSRRKTDTYSAGNAKAKSREPRKLLYPEVKRAQPARRKSPLLFPRVSLPARTPANFGWCLVIYSRCVFQYRRRFPPGSSTSSIPHHRLPCPSSSLPQGVEGVEDTVNLVPRAIAAAATRPVPGRVGQGRVVSVGRLGSE